MLKRSFLKCFILLGFTVVFFGCQNQKLAYRSSQINHSKPQFQKSIPYRVDNKTYYPLDQVHFFSQEGIASWYGSKFHGKETSNHEIYNMHAMTAAHKTLPFNSLVGVSNLENGKKVTVRINDRGPFVGDRIIDLSHEAAKRLGMVETGTAHVRLKIVNSGLMRLKSSIYKKLTSNRYAVQIGIFKNLENANQLKKSTKNSHTDVQWRSGSRFYRVLVGKFNQFENALKKMDQLKSIGFDQAFIVSY